ncbi:hypothetical protein [Tropicibacter naphthalenivorans]|uniref:Double-GTPase 1 domain-containing protein n=1 Tax=Tropicibacter naphthalenivorans TaxID=441103 RepID=A0A0P1GIA8_9RHOB|nr:hypothetical protein [Tropicibacter naphthalenivorans]CUH81422.1 hypothetical protein TRN7648_03460 [Tropicibacter naphthalenivorans]SMD00494.1 hypothetical protein SAMN04488093_109130 [Tropicibacter naphthalenivorans]
MSETSNSILLVGESGVGKTHFGAQLLRRLMQAPGALRMNGAATNLEAFEAALEQLDEGRAAGHTARSVSVDSVWPVIDANGCEADLVWPEYGGEQIKSMIENRRLTENWQKRIEVADAWLLLIRLQQTSVGDDIFTKPLADLRDLRIENHSVEPSDQARLVELLQMLIFTHRSTSKARHLPRFGVLLTCWDEAEFAANPSEAFEERLPLVSAFIRSHWKLPLIMGLSSLERPLSSVAGDEDYACMGPEHFGYVIKPDGTKDRDLTLPIHHMLTGDA